MAGLNKEKKIIKRIIKKSAHVHHGGAWKIAYADFVTAMMAFFLLMWLINTISIEQKKGIADYFTPNTTLIQIHKQSANIFENKDSGNDVDSALISTDDEFNEEEPENKKKMTPQEILEKTKEEQTLKMFSSSKEKLRKSLESNIALKSMSEQVKFQITKDTLNINIIDQEDRSMFPPGSLEMYDYMKSVIEEIAKTIKETGRKISITGHTNAIPYANTKKYTNWELSADRANVVRRALEDAGVPPDHIAFVQGKSSMELLNKDNPASVENRRMTISLLK